MNSIQNLIVQSGVIFLLLTVSAALSWYWIFSIHLYLRKKETNIKRNEFTGSVSTTGKIQTDAVTQALVEINFLKTLSQLCLFFGLLGTVIGITQCLESVGNSSTLSEAFATGVARALFTTGTGICAALPGIFIIPGFRRRCKKITMIGAHPAPEKVGS